MTPESCHALRKPTIAPVTAGSRSVQAIATSPGVRLYFAPISRRCSTSFRFRESRGCGSWGDFYANRRSEVRDPIPRHGSREQPGRHWRINNDADLMLLDEWENLFFDLPGHDGIRRLQRSNRRNGLSSPHLRHAEVGNPNVPDFPFFFKTGQHYT